MISINKITKKKTILKFLLEDINELSTIDFKKIIPQTGIIEKSIEITYKNKEKILIIDFINELKSTKSE